MKSNWKLTSLFVNFNENNNHHGRVEFYSFQENVRTIHLPFHQHHHYHAINFNNLLYQRKMKLFKI
uniref:Uncharacterized protein n=1 Tax=Tetranychus urticae TaxID=32264 RepID=T1KBL4_TETUR